MVSEELCEKRQTLCHPECGVLTFVLTVISGF